MQLFLETNFPTKNLAPEAQEIADRYRSSTARYLREISAIDRDLYQAVKRLISEPKHYGENATHPQLTQSTANILQLIEATHPVMTHNRLYSINLILDNDVLLFPLTHLSPASKQTFCDFAELSRDFYHMLSCLYEFMEDREEEIA